MPSKIFHNFLYIAAEPVIPVNPCDPSPCGPNSQCRVAGESPSCSCLPEFIGSPPNCRPECVSNSECPSQLACINQKCKDPCPGTCGTNAECHVVSHTPNCVCLPGFIGDPFYQCIVERRFCTVFIAMRLTSSFDSKLWLETNVSKNGAVFSTRIEVFPLLHTFVIVTIS